MSLRRRLQAWAACTLMLAGSALAQEAIDAPISIDAQPKVALPGAPIKLSGETPALQDGASVKLEITVDTTPDQDGGESEETITRELALGKDGKWSVALKDDDTATTGRYTARVLAPDGKGQATVVFDIVDGDAMDELVDQYTEAMNESLQLTENALVIQLSELTMGLPDGPEKDGMVVRVNKVVQRLREQAKHRPPPLPPVPPAPKPAEGEPALPEIDYTPVLETYRAITAESDRVRGLLRKSKAGTDNCMRMDALIESLNMVSSFSNFIGSYTDKALNLLGDKILPAMYERSAAPKDQVEKNVLFGAITATKVAIAKINGWSGVRLGLPGLALDAINHGTKYFYEKYCTRYEGAFSGTMTVQYYTEDLGNDAYWTYTVKIGGMVSLSESKPQPGAKEADASVMRGRFDGAAMGYDAYEDVMKLNPPLESMLIFSRLIVPPEFIRLPPAEMGVMFNTMVHPLGFQVPIVAERVGDKVTVNSGDAIRDMAPNLNRGLLIQVFAAGPIPVPNYQVFPMEGGQYILSRGMRRNAVLERTSTPEGQRLYGKFHREETPAGVRVLWDIEVEACAPACSKTTIDRMAAWWNEYAAKKKAAGK